MVTPGATNTQLNLCWTSTLTTWSLSISIVSINSFQKSLWESKSRCSTSRCEQFPSGSNFSLVCLCKLGQPLLIKESGQTPPPLAEVQPLYRGYSLLPPRCSSRHTCETSWSQDVSISEEETSAQIQYVVWAVTLGCSIDFQHPVLTQIFWKLNTEWSREAFPRWGRSLSLVLVWLPQIIASWWSHLRD